MKRNKEHRPNIEILTSESGEETKEENINYLAVCFQDSDIYIWGCKEFTSLLIDKEGYIVNKIVNQTEENQDEKKDEEDLSSKRKPMAERIRNCTEPKLEEMANHNLKELMEIIELNKIEKQISRRLHITEPESLFEEESIMSTTKNNEGIREILCKHSNNESDNWIHFWSERPIHESLLARKKGRHLNRNQTQYVVQLLERSPKIMGHLLRLYGLSNSNLKRISKQMKESKSYENRSSIHVGLKKSLSEKTKNLIRAYLTPPCGPKSISMMKKHIELELKVSYSLHEIRNFVKRELMYTYKKGSSRPPVYATKKTQLTKALFCTELLLMIAKGNVIINWDESSFDRSVKRQFSWLPMSKSCPIINDRLKRRASLILATWNTGEWIAMVVVDTINSYKFWLFLKLLESIINNLCPSIEKSPAIIFDNARIHSSIKTRKKIKELDLQVRFLAPYWPEVAPVERIFGMIKSKLRVLGGTLDIDFNKKKGVDMIFSIIRSLSKESWLKAWMDLVKEARLTIVEILGRSSLCTNSL